MSVLSPPRLQATTRRGPAPASACVVLLLLGGLVLSLGAGLGIRHLQKVGMSVQTVAGLTLLASGLVLSGFATRLLWRSRRWLLLPTALVEWEHRVVGFLDAQLLP